MTAKKMILSVILAFLVSNLFTTLWYMLTDIENEVPFRRIEINYGALMLNHLVYALGLVYLFPFFYQVDQRLHRGVIFGAVIAAIMFIPTGLVVRSIWTVEINTIFLMNIVAHLFIGSMMGGVVAVVYNYKNK